MLFKNISLVFFLFLCLGLNAQVRFGKVKCDTFALTTNPDIALVYKKGKTGVYNKARKKYLVKPLKGDLLYYPHQEFVAHIQEGEIQLLNLNQLPHLPFKVMEGAKHELVFTKGMGDVPYDMLMDGNQYIMNENSEDYSWERNVEQVEHPIQKQNEFFFERFGLERLDNGLIIVRNTKADYIDPFQGPLQSQQYPGEDSIYMDPETGSYLAIYPPAIPGHGCDGIYNAVSGEWFIAPNKVIIHVNDKGVFYAEELRDAVNNNVESATYYFKTWEGEYLISDLSFENIAQSSEFLKRAFNADAIFKANNEQSSHSMNYDSKKYYIYSRKGYQLVEVEFGFEQLTKPKDFVYHNPVYTTYFWLENDSIYGFCNNQQVAVSQANGELAFKATGIANAQLYEWELIEGLDTVVIADTLTDLFIDGPKGGEMRIYRNGNRLIVNNQDQYTTIGSYEEDMLGSEMYEELQYTTLVRYDTEASSVWELDQGVWKKRTPDYAEVKEIPFGYLVATGEYWEVKNAPDVVIESPRRTIILNEDFKPISYMDYFDFESAVAYPQGVMICVEQGCFFVDNTGAPITNAEWDDFEVEGNQLKAIKYKENWEDLFWDFDTDEMIDTTKYFQLVPE